MWVSHRIKNYYIFNSIPYIDSTLIRTHSVPDRKYITNENYEEKKVKTKMISGAGDSRGSIKYSICDYDFEQ